MDRRHNWLMFIRLCSIRYGLTEYLPADAYRLPQSIHVERALELGVADADAVRLILEHRREQPVGLFCLDGRPHLQAVAVPLPDLSVYASLAAGVAS